jgi:hypothetical protein
MTQTKSRDWLVVIGNFSVVAGLILVALNLKVSEMVQLDSYLYALIDSIEGDEWLYDIGIYDGSKDDYVAYTSCLKIMSRDSSAFNLVYRAPFEPRPLLVVVAANLIIRAEVFEQIIISHDSCRYRV